MQPSIVLILVPLCILGQCRSQLEKTENGNVFILLYPLKQLKNRRVKMGQKHLNMVGCQGQGSPAFQPCPYRHVTWGPVGGQCVLDQDMGILSGSLPPNKTTETIDQNSNMGMATYRAVKRYKRWTIGWTCMTIHKILPWPCFSTCRGESLSSGPMVRHNCHGLSISTHPSPVYSSFYERKRQ